MKKMIGVFAHPDDESFLAGGTIAKYSKAGWTIDLVCATRGEAGERGVHEDTVEPLGEIREKELSKAAEFLGVRSVTFLDYKDGTLANIPPGEIEDTLIQLFEKENPDIVITFEPSGVTNHPDHIKVSNATTFAFQKYAKGKYHEPKLYYTCIPQSVASYLLEKKVLPKESFGKPWRAVEDKKITTVIDIQTNSKKKLKALQFHESQAYDILRFYSIDTNPLVKQEYFILRMVGFTEVFIGKSDRVANKL